MLIMLSIVTHSFGLKLSHYWEWLLSHSICVKFSGSIMISCPREISCGPIPIHNDVSLIFTVHDFAPLQFCTRNVLDNWKKANLQKKVKLSARTAIWDKVSLKEFQMISYGGCPSPEDCSLRKSGVWLWHCGTYLAQKPIGWFF